MKRRTKRKHARKARRRVSGGMYSYAPNVVSGTRKHRKGRKRSRMGYVTGNEGGDTLLGALLGVGVGILFDKFAPITNPVVSDGVKTVAGGATYVMVKRSAVVKGAGLGLAIYGAGSLAKSSGIVQGMEDFIRGIGNNSDALLIEMNGTPGTVDVNSTNFIGNQSEYAPSIVSGDNNVEDVRGEMPSVVSGY